MPSARGFVLPGEPKGFMVGQAYFTPAPSGASNRPPHQFLRSYSAESKDCRGPPRRTGRRRRLGSRFIQWCVIPLALRPRYSVADINAPPRSGKPPFDANKMETFIPNCAGGKYTLRDFMLTLFKSIFALPRLLSSRPSVVDARIHGAGVPSPYAVFPSFTGLDYTVHKED